MGRKKATLHERSDRMTQRRRKKYDDLKPFIELFKPEYQRLLIAGKIAEEFKSLLHNGDKVDVRTLIYLFFRLAPTETDDRPCCTPKQVHEFLRRLKDATGSEGTKYGWAMIIRYITNGHSNLLESESSLQSAINKVFRKYH